MIFCYYNSRDINSKKPFGAVATNNALLFNFKVKDGVFVYETLLVVRKDNCEAKYYKMEYSAKEDDYSIFSLKLTFDEPGLYWYSFLVKSEIGEFNFGRDDDANLSINSTRSYQLTVFKDTYMTPDYIKGGLIYHIFMDRFSRANADILLSKQGAVFKNWKDKITIVDDDGIFKANDFYGGNFAGIKEKLPYLKSLGVTLLYLSPIFKSPSNHRYNISDYMELDELLGDEKDFQALINEAEKNGIKIMLDGVFNHTGADSIYFNKYSTYAEQGAYQSRESKYFGWFDFDEFPDKYRCWWGVTVCPSVNQNNMGYIEFITKDKGVIDKWSRFGLGGWRLDVVDELKKHFVQKIRRRIKSVHPDMLLIGEVWEDASNKISYGERREYFLGEELDGVMNYVFKNAIIRFVKDNNIAVFKNIVMDIVENYPKQSLDVSLTLLGTHDTVRILTELSEIDLSYSTKEERRDFLMTEDDYEKAKRKLKIATFLQYVLPGVPSIYYGDEAGVEGYEDPLNRKTFPWDAIDDDILEYYKCLGEMRSNNRDIFKGDIKFIFDSELLMFTRENEKQKFLFVINNTDYNIQRRMFDNINKIVFNRNCDTVSLCFKSKECYVFDLRKKV